MSRYPNTARPGAGTVQPVEPPRPIPWDGLLICMAASLLVAVARLHALVPGLDAIRPGLLVALLGLILFLSQSDRRRSLHHLKHPLAWAMMFIVVWALLGTPFALVIGSAARFLLDNFLRTGILVVLLAACVRNIYDVRRLLMTLAVGGMVFALFAALPAGYRAAVGAGGYDPNDSAMFIALTIPLTAYFLIQERRLWLKAVFAAALMVCTVAMVRTDSRGGFLALAAVIVYIVFFFGGIKPVVRFATAGAIALVLGLTATGAFWERMRSITDPTDYNYTTDTGRKAIWERARGYMIENPVLGLGINNFANAEGRSDIALRNAREGRGFKWSVAHSMWYTVGPELGVPGLIAFVSMFIMAALYLRRVRRLAAAPRAPPWLGEAGGLAAAMIGSLIAIAVAGTFLSMAYHAMVWCMFGIILGYFKVLRFGGVDVTRRGGPARWVLPGAAGATLAPAAAVPAARTRNVAFAPRLPTAARATRYTR